MNGPTVTNPKAQPTTKALSWRTATLLALYLIPPLAYFCLGAWWLFEKGLLLYGLTSWLACTIVFAVLSKRWFKGTEKILPPLDWEKPWTFAPRDAQAWSIVQETAEQANELSLDRLTRIETYREASDELARRVAACYHPKAENPLDKVPIVDLIVAIQLAAEDLERLCRQVPVMDQLTPGHLKGITKAMGVAQSANEIYNFALPVFRPVTGLPRLLVQKFVAEPAWRQTKEGVQRWLFRAYVNRLGVHLVELCSGRLRAGSAAYRLATGRTAPASDESDKRGTAATGERRIAVESVVLIPDASEKTRRELIGHWRHLAASSQNDVAETLNETFRSLEGLDYLADIVLNPKSWPVDPALTTPDGDDGDTWQETLEILTRADLVIVDLRNAAGETALQKARILIDRLGSEYDRLGDWPVGPIVLICRPQALASLAVHPHLNRETRICETAAQLHADRSADAHEQSPPDPEIEPLATIATALPLALRRHYARQMTVESRKSGLRRAAGQVAEAAGQAGIDLVRGWLKRKNQSSQTQTTQTSQTDENA